jgi:putative endopeptidase
MTMLTTGVYAGEPANQTAGIDTTNLNRNIKPGTDFFEFANGGWMKLHPLTAEYSRYGSFDQLAENNRKQLKDLITREAKGTKVPGSIGRK